jgi:hypothetical protein
MMHRKIVPFTYLLVVLSFFVSIYAKATNQGHPEYFLLTFVVTQYLFAFIAIIELNRSKVLLQKEKADWRLYLLLSPLIYGIFYFKMIRKKMFYTI